MLPEYLTVMSDLEYVMYRVRDVVVMVGDRDTAYDRERDEAVCLLDLKYRVLRADQDVKAGHTMDTSDAAISYMQYVVEESGSGESFREKATYIMSCHALWDALTKEEVEQLVLNFEDEVQDFPGSELFNSTAT